MKCIGFDLVMKPKLIIVEGPDGMGKTSLARFIARRLNAMIFHATAKGIQNDQAGYLLNILHNVEENMALHDCPVVLDRHWPSEVAYAPVLRPTKMHHTHELFAKCVELEAQYIFCMPQDTNSLLRFVSKQEPGDADLLQYKQIMDNYWKLITSLQKDNIKPVLYYIEQHGSDLESFLNSL